MYESFVKEKATIMANIAALKKFAEGSPDSNLDDRQSFDITGRTIQILELYQYQPGILDPVFNQLIQPFVEYLPFFVHKWSQNKEQPLTLKEMNMI